MTVFDDRMLRYEPGAILPVGAKNFRGWWDYGLARSSRNSVIVRVVGA